MHQVIKYFICFLLFFFIGCEKIGSVEFVQVVQDHKKISIETLDEVIFSIQDEIEIMKKDNIFTDEMEIDALNLIDRLKMIQNQSIVISDFVHAHIVNEDLMERLLKAKLEFKNANIKNDK